MHATHTIFIISFAIKQLRKIPTHGCTGRIMQVFSNNIT